jgi:hypothetical protein
LLLPQAASHMAPAAEPAAVIRNLRRDRFDMGAKRLVKERTEQRTPIASGGMAAVTQ